MKENKVLELIGKGLALMLLTMLACFLLGLHITWLQSLMVVCIMSIMKAVVTVNE